VIPPKSIVLADRVERRNPEQIQLIKISAVSVCLQRGSRPVVDLIGIPGNLERIMTAFNPVDGTLENPLRPLYHQQHDLASKKFITWNLVELICLRNGSCSEREICDQNPKRDA
jgi:hypothetical protein